VCPTCQACKAGLLAMRDFFCGEQCHEIRYRILSQRLHEDLAILFGLRRAADVAGLALGLVIDAGDGVFCRDPPDRLLGHALCPAISFHVWSAHRRT